MKDHLPLNPAAQELDAPHGGLSSYPPADRWDDWSEYDAQQWPRRVEKHYSLIPTICFNCEAACGLLAYIDKEKMRVQKFEGNPAHPGSRGRNCAKGPATINQVNDPERILYPLRRTGKRGERDKIRHESECTHGRIDAVRGEDRAGKSPRLLLSP